jgi:predicted DNA-binding transcriptional regulator YafY
VDRVAGVDVLDDTFTPPDGLDPVRTLEEHLAEGWKYEVEILVDAPVAAVAAWVPRNLGRLHAIDADHTRLVATTDEPDWYAEQLTAVKAPFRIVRPRELREAAHALGQRLLRAGTGAAGAPGPGNARG